MRSHFPTRASRTLRLATVLLLVASCQREGSPELSQGAQRLVGVWTQDIRAMFEGSRFADQLPEDALDWDTLLASEEASFQQMIFREDGILISGGMMLGHPVVEEVRWEVVDESEDRLTVRTTEADGREDTVVIVLSDDDTIIMEVGRAQLQLKRDDEVAPVPWLREAVSK